MFEKIYFSALHRNLKLKMTTYSGTLVCTMWLLKSFLMHSLFIKRPLKTLGVHQYVLNVPLQDCWEKLMNWKKKD